MLRRDDYTVAWVCALHIELVAAQEMLDEEHCDLERDPADNNGNLYALGSISGHVGNADTSDVQEDPV